jgi:hypothetical protein
MNAAVRSNLTRSVRCVCLLHSERFWWNQIVTGVEDRVQTVQPFDPAPVLGVPELSRHRLMPLYTLERATTPAASGKALTGKVQ